MTLGAIRSIRDLIVTVEFDEEAPDVGELLIAHNQNRSPLLVDHIDAGNLAVCLDVYGERTLQKNMPAERTGQGINIAVGEVTIGRIFGALGQPLDGLP